MKNIPSFYTRAFSRNKRIATAILAAGFIAPGNVFADDSRIIAQNSAGLINAPPIQSTFSSNSSNPTVGPQGISGSLDLTKDADSDVIARIGDTDIKIDDIRAAVEQLDPVRRDQVIHDPAILRQLVQSISLKQVVFKEAVSKQWEKNPVVTTQLERTRVNIIADSYLISTIKPPGDYPDDKELHAAYEANKAALLSPREFRISQIFIVLPKRADKDAEEKVQKIVNDIRKETNRSEVDFNALARTENDEKELADRAGEMGWIMETKLPPLVRAHVVALGKNGISEPIRLDDGWHIIKLLDARDPRQLSFDEAHDQLVQQLRMERAQKDRQAYLEKLLQQNPVTINERALVRALSQPEK